MLIFGGGGGRAPLFRGVTCDLRCPFSNLSELFQSKVICENFVQRIFKALFAKKPSCAHRAEATPAGRLKKFLRWKLRIVICNNLSEKNFCTMHF